MGIRIYKQLGWGLTDLKENEQGYTDDPRINTEALEHREELGPEYLRHLIALRDAEEEEWDAWFDLSMPIAMIEACEAEDGRVPWPIVHSGEPYQGKVLLIQSPGLPWSRYADPIDHGEEIALHPGMKSRIVPMLSGIYPFEGLYMDSRTGRPINSGLVTNLRNLSQQWISEGSEKHLDVANRLAKVMGFEHIEEAAEHIAPRVPADILQICAWTNLFTGPDVWLQLRPMLYVHWS